jgi:hypothetical protein
MVTGECEFTLESVSVPPPPPLSLSLSIAAGAQLGFGFELSSPIAFFAIFSLLFLIFKGLKSCGEYGF